MTQPPASAQPALDLLRSLGGDDFVATLTRTFLTFATEKVGELERLAAAGDLGGIAGAAHSMKSSAAQLGASALSEACAAAERAAKSGDASTVPDAVRAVQGAFDEARGWLEALAGGAAG